ncbi:MAG: diphthamide biosynthesis enzyme Dph2 [Thermoplasmatota archaeon]
MAGRGRDRAREREGAGGELIMALQPELARACVLMRRAKARLVAVQLPDGLRMRFAEVAGYIERRAGADVALLAEMCCGACMAEAHPAFDFLLHVAHDRILPPAARVLHIPYHPRLDVRGCVGEAIPLLRPPVGVVTTATHSAQLAEALALLRAAGMEPRTAVGRRTRRRAVVLGCDLSAARALSRAVSSFLFIGSGSFHPVGVELATGKPVVGADPYGGRARTFSEERDRILRQRFAAIEAARGAGTFGVLLGLYPGQTRKARALALRRILERSGRRALLLAARRFDPEILSHLGVEAAVSTACPRIALDDTARYPLPVLTPPELDVLLGRRKWEEYILDEIL